MGLWEFDETIYSEGITICGVDEAGRGSLAGPVCAAAVILPQGIFIPGLDDSKKLTAHKREELYLLIRSASLSFGIAYATVAEIEEMNIQNASYLAMNRAIAQLYPSPDLALVDGNRFYGIGVCGRCIVGGDGKSASIAAASILAKVSRDRYMVNLARKYPQYGFEKHKGYGTKMHYEMLREYGPSPIHRKDFLKNYWSESASDAIEV